jgi:anaerobic magnesium-protoporphyrin IX monomethyl ester cyclase
MRICVLEHPRIRSEKRFNDIANTPLWSCIMGGYAAAALKSADHDVVFWDTTVSQWDFSKTTEKILALAPDLLCINTVYIWEHTRVIFDFFKDLKKSGFPGHINLFGFFPTLAWKAILEKDTSVDSITIGEFEDTLSILAEYLGAGKDLNLIPGLALRLQAGNPVLNKIVSPEKNPDRFPPPLRDLAPDQTVIILASRGCYNHCQFCPIPTFYNNGPEWNGRMPRQIFSEINELVDQGHKDFYFADPNFVGPGKKGRERALELLELLRPLEITFGMETRPNDLTPELMQNLVAAGLKSILLGIESGSKSILGTLDKFSSTALSERAIRLCRAAGIEPEVGFLMFVPDSTVPDLRDNFDFLMKNQLLDRLDRTANLLSHSHIVLYGTSGYDRFKEEGRLCPTGMFGFEGEVIFKEAAVAWVAELVQYACHYVLRDMERHDSPVHWKRSDNTHIHTTLNNYLVLMFERLLQRALTGSALPTAAEWKSDLQKDLRTIIAV